jgi:hypothetical protein
MNHVTGHRVTVEWRTGGKRDLVGQTHVSHDEAVDLYLALHLERRDSRQNNGRMAARAEGGASRCPDAADWIDWSSYSSSRTVENVTGSPSEATCEGHRNKSQASRDSQGCSSQERGALSLKPPDHLALSLAPGTAKHHTVAWASVPE